MKFIVDNKDLARALQFVGVAASKPDGVIPICSNALVKADAKNDYIEIATTNLELTARLRVKAIIRDSGSVAVSVSAFSDIAKSASAALVCELADNMRLDISSENAKWTLPVLDAQDFPLLPTLDTGTPADSGEVKFSPSELLSMLRIASYATTDEETRFNISGVLLNMLPKSMDVVSTDGHRMALLSLQGKFSPAKILIPGALVAASTKLSVDIGATELTVKWDGSHVGLILGDTVLCHRMIDVNFPNYRNVIANDLTERVTVDRERLALAIQRVRPFTNQTTTNNLKSKTLKVTLRSGAIELSGEDMTRGRSSDSVPCDYDGEGLVVGLNANYLAECLSVIHTASVEIRCKNADTQVMLVPHMSEQPFEALHVIMPMRLA